MTDLGREVFGVSERLNIIELGRDELRDSLYWIDGVREELCDSGFLDAIVEP
jgi:hypothetical protein